MTTTSDDQTQLQTPFQTPLMKQYWELKAQAEGAMLLFRMGDFYELFGEDAVEAARILEITLTTRDKNKPNPIPMAGVPHHSVQGYLQRLLKAGKKVAIGEQLEDPNNLPKGVKIVRRGITRIFTPGIQFDADGTDGNYLATALRVAENSWVLACLDVSTGETLVSDPMDAEALSSEVLGLPIRHYLRLFDARGEAPMPLETLKASGGTLVEDIPSNFLSPERAKALLKSHYDVGDLGAFLAHETAAHALGVLVAYALRTQKQERLAHLRLPAPLRKPSTLTLGPRTAQHLDLLPSPDGVPSLYQLINHTRSSLGARQLRRWLLAPLKESREISARQEGVRELAATSSKAERISALLAEIYDLERISGRINAGLANPRDTLAVGRSLQALTGLSALISGTKSEILRSLHSRLIARAEALSPLGSRIVSCQRDDAPLTTRDGGIFARGANADLDRLLSLSEDGQQWLIALETRERESTGISSLKVRYNRVFGYYIEVTQSHLKNVPAHYQRKQTTVGAERFFTEELKKFEDEFVNATARQKALEQELFNALIGEIRALTEPVMEFARLVGELDALVSLARLALEPGWCFPRIDDSLGLSIIDGRHPMVDQVGRGSFVPNDLALSPDSRLTLIITGPNMGGKSTVMRQTALIVLLGQMGAPVPAREAHWGSVSSLYTRIGAHDAIARGQSTFMVEMSELAHILHNADERSLIVLDEIGRGTSTYDGISVAWASLEWLCRHLHARTLFATHYHELTKLSTSLPATGNAHMTVDVARGSRDGARVGDLRFLYKLREGPAAESFGIHVARIAGLPKTVIERAWQVLDDLERQSSASSLTADTSSSSQLSLFAAVEPVPHPALLEIDSTDINTMTPVQALNFVARLQELAREPRPPSTPGI